MDAVRNSTSAVTTTVARAPSAGAHPLRLVRRWAADRTIVLGLLTAMLAIWGLEHLVIGEVIAGRRIGYLAFGALPNATVTGRGSPDQWWRYTSDALAHDLDNSLGLWVNAVLLLTFGGHVERIYGRRACLATFAIGAASGGVAWMAWSTLGFVATPDYTLGASAGACGLVGLLLVFAWRFRRTAGAAAEVESVKAQAALGVACVVLLGLSVHGLNNASHAGGVLGGVAVGLALPPGEAWGGRRLGRRGGAVLWTILGVAALSVVLAGFNLAGRLLGH